VLLSKNLYLTSEKSTLLLPALEELLRITSQCGSSPQMIDRTYFQELQETQADIFT